MLINAKLIGITNTHASKNRPGSLDDVSELYGDAVVPKSGKMVLSDRPGLRIQLNESAVAKFIVS